MTEGGAMKGAMTQAGALSLQAREADLSEGGRRSNTKFIQAAQAAGVGQEAGNWRELVPSREIRAKLRSMKLGVVQHARGTLSKCAEGWAHLGEGVQTAMLRCPYRQGGPPHLQDAAHMMDECSMSYPARGKALAEIAIAHEFE